MLSDHIALLVHSGLGRLSGGAAERMVFVDGEMRGDELRGFELGKNCQ